MLQHASQVPGPVCTRLYFTVPHRFPWSPHAVLMVSVDSIKTRPKIHRFYRESMDFGWTMISFGKIYPCRSVIVSTLILAHFFAASKLLQVDAIMPLLWISKIYVR